ncbi:MAG TPA: ComEC family competence protein [Candidatus Moranbacteria bacterium]|nr:ComEC family competence protein [Candidatus Moranbacteria bacterium]
MKTMTLNKSKIFLILSLSFIGGVAGRSFWELGLIEFYGLAVVTIIFLTVNYKSKIIWIVFMAVLFFVLGAWRTDLKLAEINKLELKGKEFSGLVKIIKEPEKRDNHLQIIAELPNKERVLIKLYSIKEFKYGDEIKIKCNLKIPENFDDFNYQMYLAKDKIFYLCKKPKIEKTGEKRGNKIYANILYLKNAMEKNIEQAIPQPEAGLAKGLLFGGSSHLPEKLKENFSRTGMTHIIAVSGYNVTIISEYLMLAGIFLGFWRRQAFWLALAGIFIFVAMIGFPSSAVRAGVMGSLLLWAMKNGRLANADNAIIFSGAIMLLINPLSFRWDIGFQLSFLATLGIIRMSPIWENYFSNKLRALGLVEIVLMTISAQIFVLPIIAYNFQSLSVISLLANLLILLIIPITMLFVFLTAIFGFVWISLASIFSWLSYLLLHYEIEVVNFLGKFSWASIEMKGFSQLWFMAYYIIVISGIYYLNKIRKKKIVF